MKLRLALANKERQLAQIERWRNDPVLYAEERLGIKIWDKLAEILYSVRDNEKTYCYSANGIGKTEMASVIPLWWIECFDPAVVLITGSSWDTIKDTVMPRIRKNIRSTKLVDEPNRTEVWLSEERYITSRSTRVPERIAGIHSPNLLQLVEESSSLEEAIDAALDGNDTGEHSRRVYFGNPRVPHGAFYEGIKERRGHIIHVSALEHPNVISGKNEIPGAVVRSKIEQRVKDYKCKPCAPNTPGAFHLFWQGDKGWYLSQSHEFNTRVLGLFPSFSESALIPQHVIDAASKRTLENKTPTAIGCDVARFGEDETVISSGNDQGIIDLEVYSGKDTVHTAGVLSQKKLDHPDILIAVDDAGVGGGVTDNLRANDIEVIPVNFAESAYKPERFANLKAEIFWQFKEALESGYVIPDDPALNLQLSRLEYEFTTKGQIKIVSKEEYKKKYGDSPDRAEAVIINYHAVRFSPPLIGSRPEGEKKSTGKRYGRTVWT